MNTQIQNLIDAMSFFRRISKIAGYDWARVVNENDIEKLCVLFNDWKRAYNCLNELVKDRLAKINPEWQYYKNTPADLVTIDENAENFFLNLYFTNFKVHIALEFCHVGVKIITVSVVGVKSYSIQYNTTKNFNRFAYKYNLEGVPVKYLVILILFLSKFWWKSYEDIERDLLDLGAITAENVESKKYQQYRKYAVNKYYEKLLEVQR